MPESRKLASGAAAPAIAPTAGPAIKPTKIIGKCIGRKKIGIFHRFSHKNNLPNLKQTHNIRVGGQSEPVAGQR